MEHRQDTANGLGFSMQQSDLSAQPDLQVLLLERMEVSQMSKPPKSETFLMDFYTERYRPYHFAKPVTISAAAAHAATFPSQIQPDQVRCVFSNRERQNQKRNGGERSQEASLAGLGHLIHLKSNKLVAGFNRHAKKRGERTYGRNS